MKRADLFSTPFFSGSLGADINIIEEALEQFKSTATPLPPNAGGSNVGGWQSGGVSLSEQCFQCVHLFQKISDEINKITGTFNKSLRFNSWVNINTNGSYNKRHSHLNTSVFLSGVYYLRVPEGSGDIRFWDPRGHWVSKMKDYNYFHKGDSCVVSYSPKQDDLLLFPCWLDHEVDEHEGDGERISIAFNVAYNENA